MKTRTLAYWITTGLLAFAFLGGGLLDLSGSPDVDAQMAHLGYPAYFAILLGAWKVLGALAILVPGLPRLKEWAYAGMVFDLTGAVVSHAAVGDAVAQLFPAIALLGILAASWALRPASRVLAGAKEQTSPRPLGLAIQRQPQAA
jgi:uncharacterized membrane protein YphA (DoxX/SURF4 family)